MTGQPDSGVIALCMIIFLGAITFFAIQERLHPSKKKAPRQMSPNDWDMIPLGIIHPVRVVAPRSVKPAKPVKHPLFDDCVMALVALGTSNKVAKETATKILNENDVTSVEEFIFIVYAK